MITRHHGPVDEQYFYSLIKPNNEKKKRSCIKCKVVFISRNKGHRVCGQCSGTRQSVGARAEYVCKIPGALGRMLDE